MKKLYLLFISLAGSLTLMAAQPVDTTRVLCIGNSFTYVEAAHEKLAEIALSQGHYLDLGAAYVGGYTFYRHLIDLQTIKAIEQRENPWEYVFLQNQSQLNACYGENPRQYRKACEDLRELSARVKEYSPEAVLFVEQTWSYKKYNNGGFESMEEFDYYLAKGTKKMAKAIRGKVSPIGEAFKIVRNERPDINLYKKDNHHQNANGSYLKACVNYLLIFGEPFNADASVCGLDPDTCKYLQSVAERIILK